MIGRATIKNWSSTQAIIALSSGEAEFYGIVKGASVGLGCVAMCRDLGFNMKLEVYTDASAAKGIASRRGLGKTRHIAVHYLWIQGRIRLGDFCLYKCKGTENPADLLTKHLDRNKIHAILSFISLNYVEGRAKSAPLLDKKE